MSKLVAVPCFNEEDNISLCIDSLLDLKENHNIDFDILVINDGSRDKTSDILKQYDKNILLISSKQNYGLAEVFNSTIHFSREQKYSELLIFDSDNQYPCEDIPKLFNKLSDDNMDIVIGSRDFKSMDHFSTSKKFFQRLGSLLVSFSLGNNLNDVTSGFRAYSSRAIDSLFVTNSFTYTLESLYRAKKDKLSFTDVEIVYTNPSSYVST